MTAPGAQELGERRSPDGFEVGAADAWIDVADALRRSSNGAARIVRLGGGRVRLEPLENSTGAIAPLTAGGVVPPASSS